MAQAINWNPERYGSVKNVLKFDSNTGTYSLVEQAHDYTGINYNFSALPAAGTTNATTGTTTTDVTTDTTQAQTTEAFGDVRPLYAQKNDEDPFSATFDAGTYGSVKSTDADKETILPDDKQKLTSKVTDYESEAYDIKPTISKIGIPNYDIDMQYKEGDFDIKKEPSGLLSYKNIKSRMIDPAIKTAKAVFKTPAMMMLDAIVGKPTDTQIHDAQYFTAYTGGSMAGRITGKDGKYDPGNNLYHGMNKVSMYGNIEKAGKKRIDRVEKTLAKNRNNWDDAKIERYENKIEKFKQDQDHYSRDKHTSVAKAAVKKGADPMNPSEMRAVSIKASNEQGNKGNGGNGGKSIICTQMYQQTQLDDWKKTMQLWYIFQKKYLTIEHQQGYHFLFKPFVNGMKKSKVLTALGKHCAIARTNDIKHIMFRTPFSLSGRLVRLITEPICYITGKIKSWL